MSRMWRLQEFRFDEGIEAAEVYLYDGGELEPMALADAIATARSRGSHLIAWWPAESEDDMPSCIIGKVAEPLRWEQVPPDVGEAIDERLWFQASCGGRDVLLPGQGHTFRGRMTAWCEAKGVTYNVSLQEMGEMSDETRYFVLGFLSGSEPGPPDDGDGDGDADLAAWRSATGRFRRTGSWYGRWGTCDVCGSVLLPDRAGSRCEAHESLERSS
jgi:hypothetical protein